MKRMYNEANQFADRALKGTLRALDRFFSVFALTNSKRLFLAAYK